MEGVYRYRFQGTIFVEREGYLSSSDVGLSGRLVVPNDYGEIHVGYYNGDTYSKAEANDQKAFQIRGTLRPFPKMANLKGLRLTAFYDDDHPVKDAERTRFVGAVTFEQKYVNAAFEYLDAKDNASATKPVVKSEGWSLWATPRTRIGIEGLFRYDDLKPNKSIDAKKSRTLVGASTGSRPRGRGWQPRSWPTTRRSSTTRRSPSPPRSGSRSRPSSTTSRTVVTRSLTQRETSRSPQPETLVPVTGARRTEDESS